jgi:hypothetical protein
MALFALLAWPARAVIAQDVRLRFEIVEPTDTSFTIILGDARWVKRGMDGIVVDPRQRDEMVARFSVESVDGRSARAVITGMTTGISTLHMALLSPPRKSWFRQRVFWIGAAVGLAIGFLVGSS